LKSSEAINLVRYLRTEGVSVYANGDNIVVSPAGLLTPDHRELIRANKTAILAWLKWYADDIGCTDAAQHWRGGQHQ
jgi:hypothetical protein